MTQLGQRLLRRFNTVSWGGTYSQNTDVAQAANITVTYLYEHPRFNSNQGRRRRKCLLGGRGIEADNCLALRRHLNQPKGSDEGGRDEREGHSERRRSRA